MKILFLFLPFIFLNTFVYAHGISAEDMQLMTDGGNLHYIWLGATHMLTGYDHLLFLLGVVFFLTSTRDIIKFVTVFTIGHSITLIFATFIGISVNYYLIDAVIALSVIYKAFDNNKGFQHYLGIKSPNLLVMVLLTILSVTWILTVIFKPEWSTKKALLMKFQKIKSHDLNISNKFRE